MEIYVLLRIIIFIQNNYEVYVDLNVGFTLEFFSVFLHLNKCAVHLLHLEIL
jgi:hypothetical protein